MSSFEPWVPYPSLTVGRLSTVAGIIRSVRREAVALHDPECGDNAWCLGCRIYARTCYELTKACSSYDWLSIVPESEPLSFTFSIGSMPFKFYRGSPDDPPSKLLEMTFGELRYQQLAFDIEGVRPPLDKVLRVAVETHSNGEVSNISVVELETAGQVTGTYCIPAEFERSNVTPLQAKPVELPAPTLEPIEQKQEEKKADGRISAISSVLG